MASKRSVPCTYEEFDDAQRAFDAMNDHVLENVSGVRIDATYRLEEAQTNVSMNWLRNVPQEHARWPAGPPSLCRRHALSPA